MASDSGNNNLVWEEVSTEHIVQDEWIDFRRSTYRFPDGSTFGPYYSYSRRDYVVIVASDEEGNYLCVRQFRQGIREVTVEFPAGGIEQSGNTDYSVRTDKSGTAAEDALAAEAGATAEDALAAAKRELQEETGYVSDKWTHLLTLPANATIADNYAYLFLAEECQKTSEQDLDEMEFLNVEKYKAEEIEERIYNGGFQQAMHVMAWLLAKETLRR